jgi:hypothetical protein
LQVQRRKPHDVKTATKILTLGAACAACCAIPLAIPPLATAFAGSTFLAFGVEPLEWIGGLTILGVLAFLLLRFFRPPHTSPAAPDAACGCSAAANVVRHGDADPTPIACTLSPADFRDRIANIRLLAARSLHTARREPLRLYLTYAPDAAEDVRALVREEQACCPFLQFEVREHGGGVHVTITAPDEARDAASDLFAHIAPDLAQDSTMNSINPKEPVPS